MRPPLSAWPCAPLAGAVRPAQTLRHLCRLAGKVASVKLSQEASEAAAAAVSAARLQVGACSGRSAHLSAAAAGGPVS